MAYNTVPIKKDVDNRPIPQYYNPINDQYEVLQRRNGASRVELYDANGNPVDLASLITIVNNIYNRDTTKTYYGKSSDTKPTSGVVIGSVFFEIDTKTAYMWDGTGWVML